MNKKYLFLISALFLLFLIPQVLGDWTEGTTGVVGYWKHDNATTDGTTSIDSHGINNGTITGAVTGVDGKINEAYTFSDCDKVAISPRTGFPTGNGAFTYVAWVNPDTISGHTTLGTIIEYGEFPDSLKSVNLHLRETGEIRLAWRGGLEVKSTTNLTVGNWFHVAGTYSGSEAKVYVNGVLEANESYSSSNLVNDHATIGVYPWATGDTYCFIGTIDEVGIWNRTLNSTEISDLYNSGAGLAYPFTPPDDPPTSTLISPADSYESTTGNISFVCNATDDKQLTNITLYIWNTTSEYYTNTTLISGTSNSSSWTINNIPEGNYTWNCEAYDNISQSDWDTNRTFTVAIPILMNGSSVAYLYPYLENYPIVYLGETYTPFIPEYLFAHTNATIPIASAGVWYNITFDEEEALKEGIEHNYNGTNNDTFTIIENGVYDLHGHLSFQDSATNPTSNVVFRFIKNGEEIGGSLREIDLDKKDWDTLGSTTVFVDCDKGDELKFQFTADQTTVSLESDFAYGIHKDTGVIKIKRIA